MKQTILKYYKRIDSIFPRSEIINIPLFFSLAFVCVFALKIPGITGIFGIVISFVLSIFIVSRSTQLKKLFVWMAFLFLLASFLIVLILLILQLLVNINNLTVQLGGTKELVIALVTFLTAVLTITAGKVFERWLNLQQELSNEVKPTYKKFNVFLIALCEENLSMKERETFIIEINEGIFSWGSYGVKKHWKQVRSDLLSKGLSDQNLLPQLENLWLALRKQVGLPDEPGNQLSEFLDLKVKNH